MNPLLRAADRAAATTFGSIARVRSRGALHPDGVVCRGVLRVTRQGTGPAAVPLFDEPGEHAAICRFSRGIGLPAPVPDVLGIALRLPEVHGPGHHQDLLFASSSGSPVLRHLFLPATGGFSAHPFSTVQPYLVGDDVRVLGVHVSRAGGDAHPASLADVATCVSSRTLRLVLTAAPLAGARREIAVLELDALAGVSEAVGLRFSPSNTGGGLRPYPASLTEVRRAAYRASQRHRPATVAGI
jgi:hypothetical protein